MRIPPALGEEKEVPVPILSLTGKAFLEEARRRVVSGAGVAGAIYKQACLQGRFEPEAHGLNSTSIDAWRSVFSFDLPELVQVASAKEGAERRLSQEEEENETAKAVLRFQDGREVECVRIPMGEGKVTLCVSSQVGCRRACAFCETGGLGFVRDLQAHEIVAQVVFARTVLGWPIRSVVFMGMGEPLDNTDNVIQALRVLNSDHALSYGQQRLNVCTAGVPEGLERLAALNWKRLDISISLNAATNAKRDRLMPINKKVPLEALQQALIDYPRREKFVFAINYCLIPGFNDTKADAKAIADFCAPLGRVMVNVIPYNPGSNPIARAPTDEETVRFVSWVDVHVPVRPRATKGRSVMGACGQLGKRSE